jgi:hypothetical protein
MRTALLATILGAALAVPAYAGEGTVTGAAGGAVTGAVVGGPVGAAVGGVVGAAAGTLLDPPPDAAVTYVRREQVPSVVYKKRIVVGEPLGETVEVHPIPKYDAYSYAVVNKQRVIVDRRTRRVIQVIE